MRTWEPRHFLCHEPCRITLAAAAREEEHMKTLFAKLNVSNRLEAASYALKHKLVR